MRMFWKRKAPSSDAVEGAPVETRGSLQVRPAIEQCLLGSYDDFLELEVVSSVQSEVDGDAGIVSLTRFQLPGDNGNQGVAAFYFRSGNPTLVMFSTVSTGPLPKETQPQEEEARPEEEPVRTVLGMKVASNLDSNES